MAGDEFNIVEGPALQQLQALNREITIIRGSYGSDEDNRYNS